jgi:hypothetical protein
VSGPLRRRLDELERAVEGIKEARVAGEERRAYWEHFCSPEQVEARDRERRQGDRDLLGAQPRLRGAAAVDPGRGAAQRARGDRLGRIAPGPGPL